MNEDFKEATILLMQQPILHQPISELTENQCVHAFELISELVNLSTDEEYTQVDYIQMARLEFYLGELSLRLKYSSKTTIEHYRAVSHLLQKGGFDLSLNKWTELVSLRIK